MVRWQCLQRTVLLRSGMSSRVECLQDVIAWGVTIDPQLERSIPAFANAHRTLRARVSPLPAARWSRLSDRRPVDRKPGDPCAVQFTLAPFPAPRSWPATLPIRAALCSSVCVACRSALFPWRATGRAVTRRLDRRGFGDRAPVALPVFVAAGVFAEFSVAFENQRAGDDIVEKSAVVADQ